MIKQIDNKNPITAQKIRSVFQSSYAIEADLLQVELADFPPLQRTLEQFIESDNYFYAYFSDEKMAAVTEVKLNKDSVHIQSMVVEPSFFRQGVAEKLIRYMFNTHLSPRYTVETGAANPPAIALYKKLGFNEVDKYLTKEGIEKVRMKKTE